MHLKVTRKDFHLHRSLERTRGKLWRDHDPKLKCFPSRCLPGETAASRRGCSTFQCLRRLTGVGVQEPVGKETKLSKQSVQADP